jgi:glutaredoxin
MGTKMAALRLIFFQGCPNAIRARNLLRELGLAYEEISQDDLPLSHALRGYSSPTVLHGEKIIFGSKTGENSGGCSLDIPTPDEMRELLLTTKNEGK